MIIWLTIYGVSVNSIWSSWRLQVQSINSSWSVYGLTQEYMEYARSPSGGSMDYQDS